MTYVITANPDGTATIAVDFADEGITLSGETAVKGGEADALRYLPIFAVDLRRNFADLFPQPEQPAPDGGMMP